MSLELFLVDGENEFQRLLRDDAEAAARRAGLQVAVHFTGNDFSAQLKELRRALSARPQAILVLSVRDHGLDRVVAEAAEQGVHWVFLNRSEDDLSELRQRFPRVGLTTVCPDEIETGRIQGRVFRVLAGSGVRVLYAEGSRRSLVARDRTAGVKEALEGSSLELVCVEAGWSEQEAHDAVRSWLRIAGRAGKRLGLVGGQNDVIAVGARRALKAVADELGRPEMAAVPVVGCDGTPGYGRRLVGEGLLKATVALPPWSGLAVDTVARTLRSGQLPPPLVMVKGAAFPPEDQLHRP